MSDEGEPTTLASSSEQPHHDESAAPPVMASQRDDVTIRAAQTAVDDSILALGGYWPPLANLARLFEECGELARAVNQTYGPKPRKPDETQVAIQEELGDILYVTLALANDLGVDADAALAAAVAKAQRRASSSPHPPREGD